MDPGGAMLETELATLFAFVAFGILAFIWNLFLLRSKNAECKRRVLKLGLPVVAIMMATWVVLRTGDLVLTAASLVVIAVVAYSYRSVRFCDRCGCTVYSNNDSWLTPPTVCSQCGAPLPHQS
jgi:hypothetical protein